MAIHLPQDKPKSLILFVALALAGLLIFVPLAALGLWAERVMVFLTGSAGIALTWLPAAFLGFLFAASLYAGRYKDIRPAPWREQVW